MQKFTPVKYKIVPNFEGAYRVGTDGSVWSRRLNSGLMGSVWKKLNPRPLKNGYLIVTLVKKRKSHYWLVHRLVLTTFVGPCPEGYETRHFPNPNRTDNRLANLRWGSKLQNDQDKVAHGTRQEGEKHGMAKLSENEVIAIRKSSRSRKDLAAIYGVSYSSICMILRRVTWKHLV